MIDNRPLLRALIDAGRIAVDDGGVLARHPSLPSPALSWSCVEGMLLGLAIGDALGDSRCNKSFSESPGIHKHVYWDVTDYLPNSCLSNRSVGLPANNTQLTFWTLEQLMEDDGLIPEHLANRLASDRLYKPGRAMQQFQRRYTNERLPWTEAGVESAGTGALKRIAPILIPHLCRPTTALWADTLLASMITHNDRGSNAACVAFVAIFWDLLHMKTPPEEGWWVFRFRQVASDLEGNTHYRHCVPNHEYDHDGPIWVFVEDSVCDALRHGWSTLDACSMWRSGAYLLETLPSLIYILEKYAAQPEQAIVRAVNDTQHSATIAALVGAAVGALHGRDALPSRWIENLLGRTRAGDDGHVFELIASAKEQFFTESHWHYSVLDNSPNLL